MNLVSAIVILIAIFTSGVFTVQTELTDATFHKTSEQALFLVKFYSPNCGHCKALEAPWRDVAQALRGVISVGQLDVTKNRETSKKFNVEYIPDVRLFRNYGSEVLRLSERATFTSVLKFVVSHLPIREVNAAALSSYISTNTTFPRRILYLYQSGSNDEAIMELYTKMHREYKNHLIFAIAAIPPAEVTTRVAPLGISGLPAIVASSPTDRGAIVFKGAFTDYALREFLDHIVKEQAIILEEQEPHLSHGAFTIIFFFVTTIGIIACLAIQRPRRSAGKEL